MRTAHVPPSFSGAARHLTFESLAGSDPAMTRAIEISRKVSNTALPILVLGETGVGKDALSRAIHTASARAAKPFTAINCAAIPASLLASELFGYAPGTFTDGAKSGYVGKLVASQGGTVFLDEIGDMPLELQAFLLRVIDDRAITPLGSHVATALDVRFISATHCDLRDLVQRGRFRQDLYYRIKGAEITLPPLRHRIDLPELVERFANEEARRQGRPTILCPHARHVLCHYDWPGNIRELRSTLKIMLSMCESEHVTINAIPSPLIEYAREALGNSDTCRCGR
ncbi:MAG: sigma-54-dependent Fis family transcriptional regulator [Hyphomicrobium sp.]